MDTRTAVFFIVIVLLTLTITALEGVYQMNKCPLCGGTGEVINRPSRLIGATYWGSDSGDEKLEPCPMCTFLVKSLKLRQEDKRLKEVSHESS